MNFTFTLFLSFVLINILSGQPIAKRSPLSYDPGNPDALHQNSLTNRPEDLFFSSALMQSSVTRQDSTHEWAWDTITGAWNLQYRYLYSYAGGPNVASILYQRMEAGEWRDYVLYTLMYDAQDNLVDYIEQFWNGIEWRNISRYTYAYDSNNNLVEEVLQDWNVNAWKNFYQFVYTYDGNNNLITQTNREWQAIAWVNVIKREYTFDENNLITQQLRQDWDGGWENAFRYFYTYDTLNNLILFYSEKWESNTWVKNYRNEYEYDSQNNRILLQRQNPAFGNLWSFDYQFVYTYDDNNQLTSETEQDHQSTSWVNVDRLSYAYDADQNQVSEVYQEWTDHWLNVDSSYYYYNTISSLEGLASGQAVLIFPNPAHDQLNLQVPAVAKGEYHLEVFSGTGIKVFEERRHATSANWIDISRFAPGIYFLKIRWEHQSTTASFLKS